MKITEKNINDIPVTIIKTKKFRSIVGMLCFKMPIKKEMITERRLIRMLLFHTCNKYKSPKDLSINLLNNYGAYYNYSVVREGNYIINKFVFRILEDRYTKEGNLKNALDTFKETIFNPNCDGKCFNKEEFDLFYQRMKADIESIIERPRDYTMNKLCDEIGKDTPISYRPTIDILSKITKESLYQSYLDMINNSEKEFIIAGNLSDGEAYDYSEFILKDLRQNYYDNPLIIKHINAKIPFEEKQEEYNGKQSILIQALKLSDLTEYERLYVLPIYTGVLGGGSSSRLFSIVREENSLAYSCYSRYEKDDSLIYIISGIESSNYKKTLSLIKKVVESMNEVSEDEILIVKQEIISSLKESFDDLQNYPQIIFNGKLYNMGSIENRIENIKKVTKEDIEKVHKKVFLTNSYFLKGMKTNGIN